MLSLLLWVLTAQAKVSHSSEWETRDAAVQAVFRATFEEDTYPRDRGLDYVAEEDVIGDGTKQAIVDFNNLGAYTDSVTVVRLVGGKPAMALFSKGSESRMWGSLTPGLR